MQACISVSPYCMYTIYPYCHWCACRAYISCRGSSRAYCCSCRLPHVCNISRGAPRSIYHTLSTMVYIRGCHTPYILWPKVPVYIPWYQYQYISWHVSCIISCIVRTTKRIYIRTTMVYTMGYIPKGVSLYIL